MTPSYLPVQTKFWYNAGLEFLYIPDDERREALSQKNNNTKQIHKQAQYVPPKLSPQKSHTQANPRSSQDVEELYQNTSQSPYPLSILHQYEWSDEWKTLYTQVIKNQQPKVAWTYTGFHADLVKNEYLSAQRQEIIRTLLKKLARQTGTHAFIPYDSAIKPGELLTEKNCSFYWSAIAQANIRHLLIFGSQTRDTLLIPKRGKYSSFNHNGYRIYILPDLNMANVLDEQQALFTFLNNQLLSVNI